MSMNVWVKSGRSFNLIDAATATGAGTAIYKDSPYAAFQAIVTGTGALTATVLIQASNEKDTYDGTNSNWITIGTITLSGTTTATDGFTTIAPWMYVRAEVSAITGTGATVKTIMGV